MTGTETKDLFKNIEVTKEFPPKGLKVERIVVKEAVEVPGLGSMNSLYSKTAVGIGRGKGNISMTLVPSEGLIYCEYQGKSFFVHVSNVKTGWF